MEYTVKLNLFRGKKSYNENMVLQSEMNQITLSPYNGLEWNNFMKYVANAGYTDGEVIGVFEIKHTEKPHANGKEGEISIITTHDKEVDLDSTIGKEISAVVKVAFDTAPKVVLTKEQQELADLKAEMVELRELAANKSTKTPVKEVEKTETIESGNDDLTLWKEKYKKTFNKKAHHSWSVEVIEAKIEAELSK